MSILEFLKENRAGGMWLEDGRVVSLSNYINNWIGGLELGRYDEEEWKRRVKKWMVKRGAVKKGDCLGNKLMDLVGYEGEGEVEKRVNVNLSLKEVGLLSVCVCECLDSGVIWEGDIGVLVELNKKLVNIIEKMEVD